MRRIKRRLKTVFVFFLFLSFIFLLSLLFLKFIKRSSLFTRRIDSSILRPDVTGVGVEMVRNKLLEKNMTPGKIFIASDSAIIIASIEDGPTVFFALDKSIDWQISSLQQVLTQLTIGDIKDTRGKIPKIIDFRGERPIVRF